MKKELTFGDRLKSIRIERGLSQEEFAQILETSKQVISRYETNQRTPKITVAEDYAKKLNVSLSFLLKGNQTDWEVIEHPVTNKIHYTDPKITEWTKKAYENPDNVELLKEVDGLTKEDLQFLIGLVRKMKG